MKTTNASPHHAAQISVLTAQNAQFKQELAWLKRQLFGVKSEKQVIDNPDQVSLFAIDSSDVAKDLPNKQVKAHTRSSKKHVV